MKITFKQLLPLQQKIVLKYVNGLSTYDIAKELNTYPYYINKILKINNIKRRTRSELNHIRFSTTIPIHNDLMQMIDGWLLGDGSLTSVGIQANFTLSSKYEEYIHYVENIFNLHGISSKIYSRIDKKYKTVGYHLRTHSTNELGQLYQKWYKNGKKIVPIDIELSIICIKNWIMDDGTLNKKSGHLRFCTCAFTVEECQILSDKICKFLGKDAAAWVIEKKKYPRIYVPKKTVNILFNIIGESDVKCFEYKFQKV